MRFPAFLAAAAVALFGFNAAFAQGVAMDAPASEVRGTYVEPYVVFTDEESLRAAIRVSEVQLGDGPLSRMGEAQYALLSAGLPAFQSNPYCYSGKLPGAEAALLLRVLGFEQAYQVGYLDDEDIKHLQSIFHSLLNEIIRRTVQAGFEGQMPEDVSITLSFSDTVTCEAPQTE